MLVSKLLVDLGIWQFKRLMRERLLWLVTLLLAFPFTMLFAFSQLHDSLLAAPYLGSNQERTITAISLANSDQQQPLPLHLAEEFNQAFALQISYERHLPGIMQYQQRRVKLELSAFSGGYKQFGVASYIGDLSSLDFPQAGTAPGIAISYDFWQRHFNADAKVIGHIVKVNERDYQIAAVMSPGFTSFRQNVKTDAIIVFSAYHLNQKDVFPDTLSYLLAPELENDRLEKIRQHLFDNFLINEKQQLQQSNAIGIGFEKYNAFKQRLNALTALISLLLIFCAIAYLGFIIQRQQHFQGEYKVRQLFGALTWQINLQRLLDVLINSGFLLAVGLLLIPLQNYIAGLLFPYVAVSYYVSMRSMLQWFLTAFIVTSVVSILTYWFQDKFLFTAAV